MAFNVILMIIIMIISDKKIVFKRYFCTNERKALRTFLKSTYLLSTRQGLSIGA
jgi:hypothetical protein